MANGEKAGFFEGLTGLLVLFAAACVMLGWIAAAAECPGKPEDWPRGCSLLKFFYDWQQLLGSFVAIGAALVGWHAVNRQIEQTETHEQERNRRRLAASRATLPLALGGISSYAVASTSSLMPLYAQLGDGDRIFMPADGWSPPPLPTAEIQDLRAMIEVSPPDIAEAVAILLNRLQVQSSRQASLKVELTRPESVVVRMSVEQYMVDTIEIQARANELFAYGRGKQHSVLPREDDPSLAQMTNAAFSFGIFPGIHPGIDARIKRQYGPDKLPDYDSF